MIKVENKKALTSLDIHVELGLVFICSETGIVYHFEIDDIGNLESDFTSVNSYKGAASPLSICYWPSRKEVYVGHAKGVISVYELENLGNGPLFSSKKHEEDINKIELLVKENEETIVTASADKNLSVSRLL